MTIDIKKALERPSDFGYSGDNDELFVTWSLGPVIRHRDSNLLEQSNADALEAALNEHPEFKDDWCIEGCNHWAVGWVNHLSFRVVDPDGSPSAIFQWLEEWFAALSDYPIADDEDYSRREYEEQIEAISQIAKVHECVPDDWCEKVFDWMWKNDQQNIPTEDSWNEKAVNEACRELGFARCLTCDGDGWCWDFSRRIQFDEPDARSRTHDYEKIGCDDCGGSGVHDAMTVIREERDE